MSAASSTTPPVHWAVVVVGGDQLSERATAAVPVGARVIAADGGLDHAVAAGIEPTHLVGDLDSITAAGRMWAYANGVEIVEHPADKDATDAELAIATALALPDVRAVLLLGGLDGRPDRFDHLLGTLLALGHPSLALLDEVRAVIGETEFVVVHGGHRVDLSLEAGRTFSLIALHGPAEGVVVRGARWELDGARLTGTEARGVSNVVEDELMIAVEQGVVTAVIP